MKPAAVLIGFRRDRANALGLVLVRRAGGGRHGGQLALPGGNIEPSDAGPRAAAMRETVEETGLDTADIEIVAELDPTTTRTTGYLVWPFVARLAIPADHVWRPQSAEVDEVITLPVAALAADEAVGEQEFTFPGWPEPRRMPTRSVGPYTLWGLTLRLVEPCLQPALAGRWPI
jgi:8-oxo-dGTP pyrophosphatase MutT (NUDIX family)